MAKVETSWHPPWMLIGCSQQGPGHYARGESNADSYKVGCFGPRAWLIIADGLGSKPLSVNGSRLATAVVEGHLAASAAQPLSTRTIRDAFAAAHKAIGEAAATTGVVPLEYATTLAVVAIDGETIAGGAIGDSGISLYSQYGENQEQAVLHGFCSAPQSEIANQTYEISNPDWERFARFNETLSATLTAVVLATDGADNFVLHQPAPLDDPVFKPEILKTFSAAIETLTARNFFTFFANFLQTYDPDNFDDRTILVAYRVPKDHAPPAPQPQRLR